MMRVGLVVGTLLMALVVSWVLLTSSWGEERARAFVQRSLSDAVPGRLVVERLGDFEVFSPPGVLRFTAEGTRLEGASGEELFTLNEVTAELDLAALLMRDFHMNRVSISGAQIPCDVETGRPHIALPPARRAVFEPRPLNIRLENVDIIGLYLVAQSEDRERLILGRITGQLDVTVPRDEPGVKIKVRGVKGVMSHPMALQLHDATGDVDTSADTVADIRFSANASGAALTGRVRYVPRDRTEPVQVSIENVRTLDAGMLSGNPLDMLGGMGIPLDMLKQITPRP